MLPNLSQLDSKSRNAERIALFSAAIPDAGPLHKAERLPTAAETRKGVDATQVFGHQVSTSTRHRITYFAYLTSVLGAFSQSVGTPTALPYTTFLVGNAQLAGLLVASFNFAACAIQIIEYFLFRCISTRIVYAMACVFGLIGSVFMIVALPARSAALLFIGRVLSGLIAGNQLFLRLNTVNSTEPIERREQIFRFDTLVIQICLSLAAVVSIFFLEFSSLKFEDALNAATLPYLVPITLYILGLLGLITMWPRVPEKVFDQQPSKWAGRTDKVSLCALWCEALPQFLTVVGACALMGVKLFLIYVYNDRLWKYSLSAITVLSSLIELAGVLTVPLDAYVKRIPMLSISISIVSMLLIADWESTWPPVWLFSIASILITFNARVVYTEALTEASKLIHKRPSMHGTIQLILSVCMELGLGLGGFLIGLIDRTWITCVGVIVLLLLSVIWGTVARCMTG